MEFKDALTIKELTSMTKEESRNKELEKEQMKNYLEQ